MLTEVNLVTLMVPFMTSREKTQPGLQSWIFPVLTQNLCHEVGLVEFVEQILKFLFMC